MKTITGNLLISILLLSFLSVSCSNKPIEKPRAFGREKEILVICNSNVWKEVETTLRRQIEVPIHAVRWEPIFEISQIDASQVDYYKEWDKIILIESLEHQVLLKDVVNEEMMKKIGEGQGLFFTNFDIWARGQRVAGLAAPRDDELPRLVAANGDKIFKDFLKHLEKDELEKMYYSGVNEQLSDSLAATDGFRITLPAFYVQTNRDSLQLQDNEIHFVQFDPVRSIFIRWEDNATTADLDLSQKALAAYRDSVLKRIYPNSESVVSRVDTSTVISRGLSRLRVYGIWENMEEISGGVYISQFIDAPEQNRRYYIDCLLFAPRTRRSKYRYIFQLDHIMNSFRMVADKAPFVDDAK